MNRSGSGSSAFNSYLGELCALCESLNNSADSPNPRDLRGIREYLSSTPPALNGAGSEDGHEPHDQGSVAIPESYIARRYNYEDVRARYYSRANRNRTFSMEDCNTASNHRAALGKRHGCEGSVKAGNEVAAFKKA